jgi:hypothetical protein
MRLNDLLAFLFTLIAALVVVSGLVLSFTGGLISQPTPACDDYSLLLFPDQNKVDVIVGEAKLVKVRAVNAGQFSDRYEVSLIAPNWIIAKPTSFSIKAEESKLIFLYMSPGPESEGVYNIQVNVKSACVSETTSIEVNVLKV